MGARPGESYPANLCLKLNIVLLCLLCGCLPFSPLGSRGRLHLCLWVSEYSLDQISTRPSSIQRTRPFIREVRLVYFTAAPRREHVVWREEDRRYAIQSGGNPMNPALGLGEGLGGVATLLARAKLHSLSFWIELTLTTLRSLQQNIVHYFAHYVRNSSFAQLECFNMFKHSHTSCFLFGDAHVNTFLVLAPKPKHSTSDTQMCPKKTPPTTLLHLFTLETPSINAAYVSSSENFTISTVTHSHESMFISIRSSRWSSL